MEILDTLPSDIGEVIENQTSFFVKALVGLANNIDNELFLCFHEYKII